MKYYENKPQAIPNVRFFRTFSKVLFSKDWKYEDHDKKRAICNSSFSKIVKNNVTNF